MDDLTPRALFYFGMCHMMLTSNPERNQAKTKSSIGVFSEFIRRYPIVELPADIYYLSQVPVAVQAGDMLAVLVMGLLLCLLATVYPALRAAKINPVEAIHYG